MDGWIQLANVIWSIADLLRGDYKAPEYGKVIMPLVVIRRFDCLLADTKSDVLAKNKELARTNVDVDPVLKEITGQSFYNTSALDFASLLNDPSRVAVNLRTYIAGFSRSAVEVIENFGFDDQIGRLDNAGLLYVVVAKMASIDLHTRTLGNDQMGHVFEELVRKFSEFSNETAGEHFTPQDVIGFMVSLILAPDKDDSSKPAMIKTIYDPACGTGGILVEARERIVRRYSRADARVYGQEINLETFAICRSNMALKGDDPDCIRLGNSLSDDQYASHQGKHGFDYMLSHPPFGVEWRRIRSFIEDEHDSRGFTGRFGAGTPRINDASLLFLQHMLSKMRSTDFGGSRIIVVFNGSPMFSGTAGSGESEIRRWILENDWLEAIVALPDQLFYNTAIPTYFWILSNRKIPALMGKIVLLDAREYFSKMRRSVGAKRNLIDDGHVSDPIPRIAR